MYSFFADGLEEIEAIAPVDLLRRAGNEVVTVSITGSRQITGSHGIVIGTDTVFDENDYADGDLFVLPGGGPGTQALKNYAPLRALLDEKYTKETRLAAICAAPSIFGASGYLKGRNATVYPGMEGTLAGATPKAVPVVTDGFVTTGRGPGAAVDFGLELVRLMNGDKAAETLKEQLVYQHTSVV
ncbi:MAG: DJ-1 family glyoxalase III [Eubacterium sp.]|nr:DJ-1 family glyoxalase III [Eubacterium sp.]